MKWMYITIGLLLLFVIVRYIEGESGVIYGTAPNGVVVIQAGVAPVEDIMKSEGEYR